MSWRRALFVASLLAALAILAFVATRIDLYRTFARLHDFGAAGCAAFLGGIVLALLGPMIAWHIVMRAEGIPVALGTTLSSALIGRGINALTPTSYFTGETARIIHVANACGVPRRRVLATVAVSEFQHFAALTLFILGALAAGASSLGGHHLILFVTAAACLSALLSGLLVLLITDLPVLPGLLAFLSHCRVFPGLLSRLREPAAELEGTMRRLFRRRKGAFAAGLLCCFISPLVQFFLPTLFFLLVRHTGETVVLPTMTQLCVFFVASQLLIMLPITPAGLGVSEGGIIGLFALLSWNASDGASFSILFRLDDLVLATAGAIALARFGLRASRETIQESS